MDAPTFIGLAHSNELSKLVNGWFQDHPDLKPAVFGDLSIAGRAFESIDLNNDQNPDLILGIADAYSKFLGICSAGRFLYLIHLGKDDKPVITLRALEGKSINHSLFRQRFVGWWGPCSVPQKTTLEMNLKDPFNPKFVVKDRPQGSPDYEDNFYYQEVFDAFGIAPLDISLVPGGNS